MPFAAQFAGSKRQSRMRIGESPYTLETGKKMGLSTSAVFARCKRLGLELAEHAGLLAA
jgi:hypothetical protein